MEKLNQIPIWKKGCFYTVFPYKTALGSSWWGWPWIYKIYTLYNFSPFATRQWFVTRLDLSMVQTHWCQTNAWFSFKYLFRFPIDLIPGDEGMYCIGFNLADGAAWVKNQQFLHSPIRHLHSHEVVEDLPHVAHGASELNVVPILSTSAIMISYHHLLHCSLEFGTIFMTIFGCPNCFDEFLVLEYTETVKVDMCRMYLHLWEEISLQVQFGRHAVELVSSQYSAARWHCVYIFIMSMSMYIINKSYVSCLYMQSLFHVASLSRASACSWQHSGLWIFATKELPRDSYEYNANKRFEPHHHPNNRSFCLRYLSFCPGFLPNPSGNLMIVLWAFHPHLTRQKFHFWCGAHFHRHCLKNLVTKMNEFGFGDSCHRYLL